MLGHIILFPTYDIKQFLKLIVSLREGFTKLLYQQQHV